MMILKFPQKFPPKFQSLDNIDLKVIIIDMTTSVLVDKTPMFVVVILIK